MHNPDDQELSFLEHLVELRSRLLKACASCHGRTADATRDKPALKEAYHRQCIGCHERNGRNGDVAGHIVKLDDHPLWGNQLQSAALPPLPTR